jgi:hypothetical protein
MNLQGGRPDAGCGYPAVDIPIGALIPRWSVRRVYPSTQRCRNPTFKRPGYAPLERSVRAAETARGERLSGDLAIDYCGGHAYGCGRRNAYCYRASDTKARRACMIRPRSRGWPNSAHSLIGGSGVGATAAHLKLRDTLLRRDRKRAIDEGAVAAQLR